MKNKLELMFSLSDVLNKTQEAYSRERYGEPAWNAIVLWLLKLGWSIEDVSEILNSKMTRWAHDSFGRQYGHFTLLGFKKYYASSGDYAYTMITDECKRTSSLNLETVQKQMSVLQKEYKRKI